MNIEILFDEKCGYQIKVDGNIILECLDEGEVKKLTLGEISDILLGKYE